MIEKFTNIIIAISLFIPLSLYTYVGRYARFLADDYCSARMVIQKDSILLATLHWYQNWNGRFIANLFDSVQGAIGPMLPPILTPLVLITWAIILCFVIYSFNFYHGWGRNLLLSTTLAALILVATFEFAPALGQSYYWPQGRRALVPPLISFVIFIGLTKTITQRSNHTHQHKIILVSLLFTAFFIGGFHVVSSMLQIALLLISWFFGHICIKKAFYTYLFKAIEAGLLGGLISFTLLVTSPGNKMRQQFFVNDAPSTLSELISVWVKGVTVFTQSSFLNGNDLLMLITVIGVFGLMGATAAKQNPNKYMSLRNSFGLLTYSVVSIIACVILSMFPSAYSQGQVMVSRTYIIACFLITLFLGLFGYVFGQLFYQLSTYIKPYLLNRWPKYLFVGYFLFIVIFTNIKVISRIWEALPVFQNYAENWEQNHAIIVEAAANNEEVVTIDIVPHFASGIPNFSGNPDDFPNYCARDYYGVSIQASK